MNKEYKRNCPKCNKEQYYSSYQSWWICEKKNCSCKSCGNKRPNKDNNRKRICPKCKNEMIYATVRNRKLCHKRNTICYSCSNTINNKGKHIGKKASVETRQKMSNSHKGMNTWIQGRKLTKERRNQLSESTTNAWRNPTTRKNMVSGCVWKNTKCDKGQLELLEKWNRLGFRFEPNYQIKSDEFLAYVDGWDDKNKVAIEVDSKYHLKSKQKEKDLIRQQKIIDILKPKKFWRYDIINKNWKEIIT